MTAATRARRASTPRTSVTARKNPAGVVTAIVAVTGVQDEVGDIIVPGIFPASLAKRKPKVVFHHKFDDFAGRIVEIHEWMPGDPRLPKTQPNGQPWPADAGALVATMQFNLAVARGAEVYEWARFYAETGEAAWSIGYTVPPGMSAKRGGVRYIYGIDLFEVSLVLHGAHPMTMALEVKGAPDALERKQLPVAPAPANDHVNDVMVALYPPGAAAKALAVDGGEAADDLHVTLAYLGMADELGAGPDDLVAAVKGALAGYGPLSGQVGGLGVFPAEGSGVPVWAPVDVPGLEKVREAVVDALEAGPAAGKVARDHGYTPHMTLGYDLPTASPAPATPVEFGEVVVVYGHDRYPVPFGGGEIATPDLPPIETKAAHRAVAAARSLPPMEVKSMNRLPGSYEERQRLLDRALTKKFVKKKDREHEGGLMEECSWVSTEATFDDHVIATVHDKDGKDKTFSVPYTWAADDVDLGDPVEVEVAVVPAAAGAAAPAAPTTVERVLVPTLERIAAAAGAIQALPIESKQARQMEPTLLRLIDALYAKGIDVAGLALGEEDDELGDPDDEGADLGDLDVPLAPDDTDGDDGLDDDLDQESDVPVPSLPNVDDIDLDDDAIDADLDNEPQAIEGDPVGAAADGDRVLVDPDEIERELAEIRA